MFEFSEIAQKQLRAAGWTPDRSIDVTEYEEWLTQNGYVVNDVIRAVFKEFGGLHFTVPRPPVPEMGNVDIDVDFDPIEAEKSIFIENIRILEKYTSGDKLVPLGQSHWKHIETMISHSGKIYGAYVEFHLYGQNIYDYIEGLFQNRCGMKIHVPEMEDMG